MSRAALLDLRTGRRLAGTSSWISSSPSVAESTILRPRRTSAIVQRMAA
jgi:hypothetical protein